VAFALFRRLLALSTATAVLLVGAIGPAHASPPTAASGTFTQEQPTGFSIRFAGPNTIVELATKGSVSGTLTGAFDDSLRLVIHPNGKFTAKGTITCQCAVGGKEGTIALVVVDTGEEVNGVPTFAGRAVITGATGELAGLRGVLEVAGAVDVTTGLSTISYSGQIHLHP
jgi:hypothetical protein